MKIHQKTSLTLIMLVFLVILSSNQVPIKLIQMNSFRSGIPVIDSVHTKTTAASKKVAFTQNNGYFSPNSAYSQLSSYFTSRGYAVEELTTDPNATYLATVDILFINSYLATGFSPSARIDILEFLDKGGGAIMVAVNSGLDIGLQMVFTGSPIIGTNSLDIYPHPVTVDITAPLIPTNSGLGGITLSGTAKSVVNTTTGSTNPNQTIIASNYYGEGKIMACTVTTMWDDLYWSDGDNNLFIENYLNWYEQSGVKNLLFTRHNSYFSPTNGFSELANYFASQGYIIEDSATDPDSTTLSRIDLLVVNSYQVTTFSTSSKEAIEGFVSAGGGLIMVGHSGGLDFGLQTILPIAVGPIIGPHSLDYFPNPVTVDVTSLSIDTDSAVGNITLNGTAKSVVSTTNGGTYPNHTILATNYFGEGKIMTCAVTTLWGDPFWNNGDNALVIANFLNWHVNEGVKNLFFTRHNSHFTPTNFYSKLANYFASQGFIIDDLDSDPNATTLADADLLFVNSYQKGTFEASSREAIDEFVTSGGGLIISGSDGGLNYGFQTLLTGGTLLNAHSLDYFPHPVTVDVSNLLIDTSSALGTITLGETTQAVVSTDTGSTNPSKPIIAVAHHGNGKIMASSVVTIWDDAYWSDGDNNKLITNYLNWFSGNTSLAPPTISTHDDVTYTEGETGNNLSWSTTGYFPYKFTIYKDQDEYASGSWASTVLIEINIDDLNPGTFKFTIIIQDEYDRFADDTVIVTVNEAQDTDDTTPTTLTTTLTTPTTTPTTPTDTPLSILGVILGIISVSLLILKKRKRIEN